MAVTPTGSFCSVGQLPSPLYGACAARVAHGIAICGGVKQDGDNNLMVVQYMVFFSNKKLNYIL